MTLDVLRNTSAAKSLSPAATAARTRLMEVRNIERRLVLCMLRATDWRARLRAWAVFAMFLNEPLLCSDLNQVIEKYSINSPIKWIFRLDFWVESIVCAENQKV